MFSNYYYVHFRSALLPIFIIMYFWMWVCALFLLCLWKRISNKNSIQYKNKFTQLKIYEIYYMKGQWTCCVGFSSEEFLSVSSKINSQTFWVVLGLSFGLERTRMYCSRCWRKSASGRRFPTWTPAFDNINCLCLHTLEIKQWYTRRENEIKIKVCNKKTYSVLWIWRIHCEYKLRLHTTKKRENLKILLESMATLSSAHFVPSMRGR